MSQKRELFLILTKENFLEILSGEKKNEYRDFTEFYISRLADINKDGGIDTKEFDIVRFAMGYGKHRPELVTECKGVFVEYITDEEPEELSPETCDFVIDLGDILETKNCDQFK